MKSAPTLPEAVIQLARDQPDRPFLQDVGGGSMSYGETYLRARRWAAAWRTLGIGGNDRVLTMLFPCAEWFAAWMGLALTKSVEVGVNTDFKDAMLRYTITKADAKTILIDADLQGLLTESLVADTGLTTILVYGGKATIAPAGAAVIEVEEFLKEPLDAGLVPDIELGDTAALLMTSGTTGPSKYVICSWGIINGGSLTWPSAEMGPDDALYCMVPVFHGAARMMIRATVAVGGRCVFRRSFSRTEFWSDVRDYKCTFGFLPGATLPWLLNQPATGQDTANPLRFVFTVPVTEKVTEFGRRFGIRMLSGYGMTETGSIVVGEHDATKPTSSGKVRRGPPEIEVRIVDAQGSEVRVGEVGELTVRARDRSTVFSGYFNDPDATAKAWRGDWLLTGDLLREDEDGSLYFVDRVKDAIRRRGENISSLEVETIARTLPSIADCAAVGIGDPGGEQELKLTVVLAPGADVSCAELHRQLCEVLPRFMVPRYIEVGDELPRTDATARVKKAVLRLAGVSAATWDSETAFERAAG